MEHKVMILLRNLLLQTLIITRAEKNGGGGGDIFKSYQYADVNDEGDEVKTDSIFNGVDIVGTEKFLIGVNAILTQSNDVSSNNSSATEAIIPYNTSSASKGDFDST